MSTECLTALLCFTNLIFVVAGFFFWRWARQRLRAMEGRLHLLEETLLPDKQPIAAPVATTDETRNKQHLHSPSESTVSPLQGKEQQSAITPSHPQLVGISKSVAVADEASAATTPARPKAPKAIAAEERSYHPLVAWFVNMHFMVQMGVIVLFFGVGFLVKYAADQGWFPLEIRLVSAALLGAALAGVGWQLRQRRSIYGLALIGGGIGIIYLTAFGAYYFYSLIPAVLAFAIFVALSLTYVGMALLNDAPILAFLAIVGAFLAPLLASDGDGNHIVLFSYYGIVNLGVLAIARYKHWPRLNLASFFFSALAATGWAATAYQPAYFTSTAIFLGLFFAFYLLISVGQALRTTAEENDQATLAIALGDIILLFANPVVSFLLLSGLLQDNKTWLAYSTVGLAAIYGGVSYGLSRRGTTTTRFVADSTVFFATFFLTIAIPLCFDPQVTTAIWSVMGVGVIGFGIERNQRLLQVWGLLVHLFAMIAFLVEVAELAQLPQAPFTNHLYLSTIMLSITAIISGALLHFVAKDKQPFTMHAILLALGLVWWYGGGVAQFPLYADRVDRLAILLLYLTLSGLIAEVVGRWLQWRALRWPIFTVLPSATVIALYMLPWQRHPFALGWYAWPMVLFVHLLMLYYRRGARGVGMAMFHASGLWLTTFLLTWWVIVQSQTLMWGVGWQGAAFAVVPICLLFLLGPLHQRLPWPVAGNHRTYVQVAAAPVALLLAGVMTVIAVANAGDSAPLPFIPLLNPLDIMLTITVFSLWGWVRTLATLLPQSQENRLHTQAFWLFAPMILVMLNGAAARGVHHLTGVPYTLTALYDSAILQMIYALLWSIIALTLMFTAHRRGLRQVWYIGAVLLGLTVVKLFLVDLVQTGTLARIVSFIGVGLLTITIAYFWPAPPRQPALSVTES